MSLFSQHDAAIMQWLHSAPVEAQAIDCQLKGVEVLANCRDAYLANSLWLQRSVLQQAGLDLTLLLNGKVVDSTKRITSMRSSWVTHNFSAFADMAHRCTASIHSESNGYMHLAVQPFLNIEAILNKPIQDLLGQPLIVVASEIAAAKEHCIATAIRNGGTASEPYQMEWKGGLWKKHITAIYLSGHQEVLTKTSPAKGEEWQFGFWRNYVVRVPQS